MGRGARPHGRHLLCVCRPQAPSHHRRLFVPRWPAFFWRGAGHLQLCWKHCCWRHRNPQGPDFGINEACSMTYVLKPLRSKDDGTRLGYRGIVPVRAGVTAPAARAAKGRRSDPVGVGGWSVSPATVKRHTRVHVWSVAHAVGSVGACARACPRKRSDACVCLGVAERGRIKIGFAAAVRPARARPLSSSSHGAIFVGVFLPLKTDESRDVVRGWRGGGVHSAAGLHRAERGQMAAELAARSLPASLCTCKRCCLTALLDPGARPRGG